VTGDGRFGPFVRRGKTFASLKSYDELWTVSLAEAAALIEAKLSGQRAALRELGTHPASGKRLVIYSGRYGPYVTDGAVNATLPKGTEPEELDLEAAVDLLARAASRKGRGKGGRRPAARKRK